MIFFKNRSGSFYMCLCSIPLTIVAFILYLTYTSIGSMNGMVLALLILSLVAQVSLLFWRNAQAIWLRIAAIALLCIAFGLFVDNDEVILSFTDYVFSIDYWGNAALVPYVIRASIFMLSSVLVLVVSCFFKQDEKRQS